MTIEGLTAGAVARRLGVAVTTLRSWHQRYGLGPTMHVPGRHRRYSGADVARLELMQRLIGGGIPPGEAAHWVGTLPPDDPATLDWTSVVSPASGASIVPPASTASPANIAGLAGVTGANSAGAPAGAPADPVPGKRVPRRDGGGLPLGRVDPMARGLCRAALRLDPATVRDLLTEAIGRLGVVDAWDRVIRPALVAIGERYAATGSLIEVEHLLSASVSRALAATPPGPAGGNPALTRPARILLACADEEQHTLALEALAAALVERGAGTRMLGARVPPAALLAAIERTGPTAVVLWSQCVPTADPGLLVTILTAASRPLIVVAAGPGWDPASLPDGVTSPQSLRVAIEALLPLA